MIGTLDPNMTWPCPRCKVPQIVTAMYCANCGLPLGAASPPVPAIAPPPSAIAMGQGPPAGQIIVRTYRGSQGECAAAFSRDAQHMAEGGYYPVAQSWAPGSWGCGAFLLALVLAIVLVGILIFIYLLVVKPAGTLTVTYAWQGH